MSFIFSQIHISFIFKILFILEIEIEIERERDKERDRERQRERERERQKETERETERKRERERERERDRKRQRKRQKERQRERERETFSEKKNFSGFECLFYGPFLGTDPSCFLSWERMVLEKYFIYNGQSILLNLFLNIYLIKFVTLNF